MSELVSASGLSKGAFYHYFSSKEELYHYTIEKFFLRFLDDFNMRYEESISLRNNLKSLFKQYSSISEEFKDILKEGIGFSNYMLFLKEALRHGHFKKRLAVYYRSYTNDLANWFQKGQLKREIKENLNSETLAKHITYLMEGMGLLYSLGFDKEPMSSVYNKIMDQFFDQIERDEFRNK